MILKENMIEDCFGKAKPEDIHKCEKEIGIIFPDAFKRKSLDCDGGTPLKNNFNYYSEAFKRYTGTSAGLFLLFSIDYPHTSELLLRHYKEPAEFFPKDLVAFAVDGGGDKICFDYREGKDNPDPPIVIWEHEGEEGKDVSYLAPNFEAFMNMLMSEEEAEEDFKKLLEKSKENK